MKKVNQAEAWELLQNRSFNLPQHFKERGITQSALLLRNEIQISGRLF